MADDTTLRRRKRPQQQTPSPPSSDLRPQEDALKKESQGGGVSFSTAFCLIFTARLVSAMINPIADCDETFNYWEPLHFLMYGHGMQTWEYDPTYALRSYLFLNFYRAFGIIAQLLQVESVLGGPGATFYFIRAAICLFSSLCDSYLVSTVAGQFGWFVSISSSILLAVSAGTFNAGASLLPQTFATNFITLAFALHHQQKPSLAIASMGMACLVGWPFCVLIGAGIGLDILVRRGVPYTLQHGVAWLLVICCALGGVDSYYFGRAVLPPINIALYNSRVQDGEKGGTLYGTEPWDFFLKNLFLNFNFQMFTAALVPVLAGLSYCVVAASSSSVAGLEGLRTCRQRFLALFVSLPVIVWIGLMSALPHKEERFLYVIYPLFCLSSAIGLTALASTPTAVLSFCCASGNKRGEGLVSLLNVSRAAAMVRYYGAPLKIYSMLSEHHALRKGRGGGGGGWGGGRNGRPSLVCVGKEWYRFPSHFILGHDDLRLAYLKSGFTGQLPQPFVEDAPLPRATSLRREGFNDLNKEETSRYVEADMCSYIVDLELDGDDGIRYSSSGFSKKWEEIESLPFLDASQSPTYTRAFYVPVLSERMNTWAKYKLFAARNDGAK